MGRSKGWLTTKIHLASASEKFVLAFHLSPGNNHDAPEDRKLISNIHSDYDNFLLMDRAYEDDKTRQAVKESGFIPVVPPKKLGFMILNFINAAMRLSVSFI